MQGSIEPLFEGVTPRGWIDQAAPRLRLKDSLAREERNQSFSLSFSNLGWMTTLQ